jgi:hypothetical protein
METPPPTAAGMVHPVVPPGVVVRVDERYGIPSWIFSRQEERVHFLLGTQHFRVRLFAKKNYRADLPYDLDVCKYDN